MRFRGLLSDGAPNRPKSKEFPEAFEGGVPRRSLSGSTRSVASSLITLCIFKLSLEKEMMLWSIQSWPGVGGGGSLHRHSCWGSRGRGCELGGGPPHGVFMGHRLHSESIAESGSPHIHIRFR